MSSQDLDRKIEDKNMITESFLSSIFLSALPEMFALLAKLWGVKEVE